MRKRKREKVRQNAAKSVTLVSDNNISNVISQCQECLSDPNNQSIANTAAPDHQSIDEMAEPIANEREPKTNEAVPENHYIVNEEALNTSGAGLENNPAINDVPSENSSTTISVISASKRLGLLSLPAELRVKVLRQLLFEHRPLSTYGPGADYQPFPAILNASKLIRQEAFQIMYGENFFYIGLMHPIHSILNNRRIRDTIQNVHFETRLNHTSPQVSRMNFIHVIHEFGSHAIVRGTLNIIFGVGPYNNDPLFSWFVICLRRFTNFRIIQIEFVASSAHRRAEKLCPLLRDIQESHFTPVFGPARSFPNGHSLQFYPQEYLNSLPSEEDVDWIDRLDGIRLNWNQGHPNAVEPEASAQNLGSED